VIWTVASRGRGIASSASSARPLPPVPDLADVLAPEKAPARSSSQPARPRIGDRVMTVACEQRLQREHHGADSFVRIMAARAPAPRAYRDGWTSRVLRRDRDTRRWIWLLADSLLGCGYRYRGAGAGVWVWPREASLRRSQVLAATSSHVVRAVSGYEQASSHSPCHTRERARHE
jgi:hypothetical protein